MNDLSSYIDGLSENRDSWLGQMVFWHIPSDLRVNVSEVHEGMEAAGLTQFAPKPPRLSNTFRQISSSHARRGVETDTPGVYENYKIEEVKRSDRRVVKDIVVQQVDGNNEELSYDVQVRLEYINETTELRYWWIGSTPEGEGAQSLNLAEVIAEDFRANTGTYNHNVIRGILRKIVDAAVATPVLGKAYFFSMQNIHLVAGLEMLSEFIPEIAVCVIPLNDSDKQREMVREAYEMATFGKINSLLSEIDKIGDSKISNAQFDAYMNQRDEVRARTTEYNKLLSRSLKESDTWLKVYEERVMKLIKQVA